MAREKSGQTLVKGGMFAMSEILEPKQNYRFLSLARLSVVMMLVILLGGASLACSSSDDTTTTVAPTAVAEATAVPEALGLRLLKK